jgi:hypothetical protein
MVEMLPGQQRVTLGADKSDDTRDFVLELRELRVTPHAAQHTRDVPAPLMDEPPATQVMP